jgi:aryl-alcohol dehydrogenase-like predicted oxidoreductase
VQEPFDGLAPGVRAGAASLPRILWRPMSESGTGRPLGGSGISVPAIGVGANRWNASGPDQARLRDTLAAAADAGMGLFDTAEAYHAGRSDACRQMDIALVAYRPLGGGAISAGSPAGPGRSALVGVRGTWRQRGTQPLPRWRSPGC